MVMVDFIRWGSNRLWQVVESLEIVSHRVGVDYNDMSNLGAVFLLVVGTFSG